MTQNIDGDTASEKLLYAPLPEEKAHTAIEHLRIAINKKFGLSLENYEDLHAWSCENTEAFWGYLWEDLGIISSQPFKKVVSALEPMYPSPEWFPGARLNFAENMLEPCCRETPDAITIIQANEMGVQSSVTFRELKDMVHRVAYGMKAAGVGKDDVVAAYCNNRYEVIVYMLAASSLGAIYTASSPDFGPWAVYSRFHQMARLKCLLVTTQYHYNGKVYDHCGKLLELFQFFEAQKREKLQVILLNASEQVAVDLGTKAGPSFGFRRWEDLLSVQPSEPLVYVQVPFNHPQYILYSSGSTGEPKCIVHSVGGTLIQHLKEHVYHNNFKRGDKLLQVTTVAWMMWHWMVSAMRLGVTLVLYDGSPFMPDPMFLWHLIEEIGVTHFGTSAKYLALLEEKGVKVRESLQQRQASVLESLQYIFSTGSPLSARSFDYVYQHIKSRVRLFSITGGTDIISLFCGGNPAGPIYRGEIPVACLGMKVEIWDKDKNVLGETDCRQSVYKTESPGDLVCTSVFPSQPIYFDGDTPEKSLYEKAYFKTFGPFVWHHGDYVLRSKDTGGYVMLGRSDGVLNPSGVRFGSAELYAILEKFIPTQIIDALAIGQQQHQDERVILFIHPSSPNYFEDLKLDVIRHIRQELSPRHVPALILPVTAIPYTMNGKKAEVIIKKLFNHDTGEDDKQFIQALGKGLENQNVLKEYVALKSIYPPI